MKHKINQGIKMNKSEYNKEIETIRNKAYEDEKKLNQKYASSNNPYKTGDVIKDHYKTIKIDNIEYGLGFSTYPQCVYTGYILKKDGTPRKDGSRGHIYQENIIKD